MSPPEPAPEAEERAFAEPWQAEVFALTVSLQQGGTFTWPQWAEALGAELRYGAADGSDYYERWLAALETLLRRNDVARASEVADLAAAWQRAALATPHGKPILLDNDPQRLGGA